VLELPDLTLANPIASQCPTRRSDEHVSVAIDVGKVDIDVRVPDIRGHRLPPTLRRSSSGPRFISLSFSLLSLTLSSNALSASLTRWDALARIVSLRRFLA